MILAITSAAALIIAVNLYRRNGTCLKAVYGKGHRSEERARILITRCSGTFLIRNAIVSRLNKKLCGTYDSDNRENSEGNVKLISGVAVADISVKAAAYTAWNFGAFAAAFVYRTVGYLLS